MLSENECGGRSQLASIPALNTKRLTTALLFLGLVQFCFALNSKDINTPQRRLTPSREKRSLVLRLPPLVPPSFDDDDHFDERQVYNIPRVGKKSTMHDFATNSLSDESLDDEYAIGERERRYMMSGERGGEGVRQVFSKIPRVGRSTRTRRWTHMAADDEERKPWQKDDSFTENQN